MVTEEHITAFNWASPHEIDEIVALAIRINDFLSGLFLGAGIKLVDIKIEFGRLWENDMMRVILADEISPDSMRLWDIRTSEKLGNPMVTEEHITAFNWASTQEIDDMMALSLRVNDFLNGAFGAVGISLIDFRVEFGRLWENDFARVVLADEISPDNCRLWDTQTREKLDLDRFRRDLGDAIEGYAEIARRLGIMKEMPTVIQGGLH
jgi:phosphoribosylaminoimidazole-succinocarboxamide synthase